MEPRTAAAVRETCRNSSRAWMLDMCTSTAGASIAECGPLAVAAAKRVIQAGQGADVRVAHSLEQAAFGAVAATADAAEGLAAFLEKRDPKFEGR